MTFRTATVAVLVVVVVVAAAVDIYYYRLTAPVQVSSAPPTAATLAPGSSATASEPPTTTSQSTPSSAATTSTSVVGSSSASVYKIDSSQSTASYEVNETFLGDNRFATAIGRTHAISGEIEVDKANPKASRVGEIVVDISQLESDQPRRDNAIRRQWLESAKYPLAKFTHATISDLPANLTEGKSFSFKMTGDMTVHGTTRKVTWNVTAMLSGNTLKGTATTHLKMSEFNIDPPSVPGFVQAEDTTTLRLEFVARAVAK